MQTQTEENTIELPQNMTDAISKFLGKEYSWNGELCYRNSPIGYWMTDHEMDCLAKALKDCEVSK